MADYGGVYLQDEGNATINFTTDKYADRITFLIKNEAGETVRSFTQDSVPVGPGSVNWDGKDNQGNRVDEGFYYVEATGTTTGGDTFEPKLSLVGIVESITYKDGGAYLRVNGTEIALGDIVTVSQPSGSKESGLSILDAPVKVSGLPSNVRGIL